MRSSLGFPALLVIVSSALTACSGGGGDPPPPPPTPTASVNLTADRTSARVGEEVTLTWTSQTANSCVATGNWTGARAVNGSEKVSLASEGTSTYILTCGSASDQLSLTVGTRLANVTIPGLPAPINYSTGRCVPSTAPEYTIACVTDASRIPAKYDSFSSLSSSRVRMTPPNAPVADTGGACFGGFDRAQSRLIVDSTFYDVILPVAGSDISEITFSSAFLAPYGISEMSSLLFTDNSNTERIGLILYSKIDDQPLVMAMGGTVTSAGVGDFVGCLKDDLPPPSPPPSGLSCPERSGTAINGLSLEGAVSYSISNATANQSSPRSVTWGVRYNNPSLSTSSYTGTLRVKLWALSSSFPDSGTINGYPLFEGYPNFTGQGARSSSQLYNFYSVTNIVSSGTGTNPPPGRYCIVATLDQFSSTCTSSSGYCYSDWAQFGGAQQF